MATQEYVLLTSVDFGVERNPANGVVKSASEQPEIVTNSPSGDGIYPEGHTMTLDDKTAAPLLEAGSIRPSGQDNPQATDKPEEHGYAGEAQREEAQKQETEEETASGTQKRAKGAK